MACDQQGDREPRPGPPVRRSEIVYETPGPTEPCRCEKQTGKSCHRSRGSARGKRLRHRLSLSESAVGILSADRAFYERRDLLSSLNRQDRATENLPTERIIRSI